MFTQKRNKLVEQRGKYGRIKDQEGDENERKSKMILFNSQQQIQGQETGRVVCVHENVHDSGNMRNRNSNSFLFPSELFLVLLPL